MMKKIREVVLFDMNPYVRKLQLESIEDLHGHYFCFKSLIRVLEARYDVVLTSKEKVFLFMGTLPSYMECDIAYREFKHVRDIVAYIMLPAEEGSDAYISSCTEGSSSKGHSSSNDRKGFDSSTFSSDVDASVATFEKDLDSTMEQGSTPYMEVSMPDDVSMIAEHATLKVFSCVPYVDLWYPEDMWALGPVWDDDHVYADGDTSDDARICMQKEELEESSVTHVKDVFETGGDNDASSDVEVTMDAIPSVCIKFFNVCNDDDGLLDDVGGDRFDKSMGEGLTAEVRPEVPYKYVQVVIPLEMDDQKSVTRKFSTVMSHESLESKDSEHLDVPEHCNQHQKLSDNDNSEDIDPELDAILNDALDVFIRYDEASLVKTFSLNVGQCLDANESVPVLCERSNRDSELEAVLDDALMDFMSINDMETLDNVKGPKNEACISTDKANKGDVFPSVILNDEAKGVGIINPMICHEQVPVYGAEKSLKGTGMEMHEDMSAYELGVSLMLKQVCSHALVDMLLGVAFKQAMHVRWAKTDDALMIEPWIISVGWSKYAYKQKRQGTWHECQSCTVLDSDGCEMPKYVPDWPFDPGGCLYLYV